jgi:hypothetical protein
MNRRLAILLLVALACGPERTTNSLGVSKEPLSVRGWIADVETASTANTFRTVETEAARKTDLFHATNVWVENAPYVSGGVAENGAFILLDVPPGNVTIGFDAPGAQNARLVMQNIPGNADVFVPNIILKSGAATLADPTAVKVRLAARVDKSTPTGAFATISGNRIPIINAPVREMVDRHDYPIPPDVAGVTKVR